MASLPRVLDVADNLTVAKGLAWGAQNASQIRHRLTESGAVLVRGIPITSSREFQDFCQSIEPDLKTYTGGDSPRTVLDEHVYTSTDYDPDLEIYLHNELSYAGWSPRLVFFGCLKPAATGGETQVADGRKIYQALPPPIRDQFESLGISYLQHLWDEEGEPGIGKSWQQTFETESRQAAEAYLTRSNMAWQWTDSGLRTRAAHNAVKVHPVSGEKCWWNQADQWHRQLSGAKTSFGRMEDPRFNFETSGEATLGNHVTYGDGTEIDVEDLIIIRKVSQSLEVVFPWQAGDVMIVDNILAMHGRKPYKGQREIVVALA